MSWLHLVKLISYWGVTVWSPLRKLWRQLSGTFSDSASIVLQSAAPWRSVTLLLPLFWHYPAALFCSKFLSSPNAFEPCPHPRTQPVESASRSCSEQFLHQTGSAQQGVSQHAQHVLNFQPRSPVEARSQAANSSLDATFIQKQPYNAIARDPGWRWEGFVCFKRHILLLLSW